MIYAASLTLCLYLNSIFFLFFFFADKPQPLSFISTFYYPVIRDTHCMLHDLDLIKIKRESDEGEREGGRGGRVTPRTHIYSRGNI
jgi:hypothetical protein